MRSRPILLLQENTDIGGIRSGIGALTETLDQAGRTYQTVAIRSTKFRELIFAIARADTLVATNGFMPTYIAWLLSKILRKPVVYWLHGPTMDILNQARASNLKRAWLRWLYRRLARVVFVSRHAHDSFLKLTGATSQEQVLEVIPNAHPRWPVSYCGYGMHCLGFVGRLSPEKQPELMVSVLRLLPPSYRLDIVGDGVLRSEVSAISEDLQKARRLKMVGFQPVSAALFAPWQATILASCYEGCPMAVLESLAAGRPCVALPVPALQEMLATHMPYALAADCSAQALAKAIEAVCAMPREKLEHDMSEVLRLYSPERFASNWLRVLQDASC